MTKYLVIEKPSGPFPFLDPNSREGAQMGELFRKDLEYKVSLLKKGKIVGGGPFLDIASLCYILDVKSPEEMGEIFFNSPTNLWTDRTVHPLGSFKDTLEGFDEMAKRPRRR